MYRDDYDSESQGLPKDIRRLGAQFLVDDDPKQASFVKSIRRHGFLITSYRGGSVGDDAELRLLYAAIRAAKWKNALWGWLKWRLSPSARGIVN